MRLITVLLHTLVSSVLFAQDVKNSEFPDYSELKFAKPDKLPLSTDVSPECEVLPNEFRSSVKHAIKDSGIQPAEWPALLAEKPYFGLYVALECDTENNVALNVSFIASIDGTLELFGGMHDNPAGRELSDDQHIVAGGLAGPIGYPGADGLSYSRWVGRVVGIAVPRFIEHRFTH